MNCLFCKINSGDISSLSLYNDDYINVIMDTNPQSNGHILIIPKKHITDFTEIDDETLIRINKTIKMMKDKIYKSLHPVGLRFIINYGACQVVKHYHLHLIPQYETNEIKPIETIYEIIKKIM